MFSAFVALCLLNPSANNLDFRPRADNLRSIVSQLSKATGENLFVDGDIGHEIVFVHMNKTDSATIRGELAKAVLGTWVEKDGALVLERTPLQKTEIWKQHLAIRRKQVDSALAKVEEELKKPFDARSLAEGLRRLPTEQSVQNNRQAATARYRTQQQLFATGPAARLMRRLLLACDRNDLAAVGPHERRIFRFRPNKRQGRINEAAFRTAALQFAKEQASWKETVSANPFPEDRNGQTASDPRTQLQYSEKIAMDADIDINRGEVAALFLVNLDGHSQNFGRTTICQMNVPNATRDYLNAMSDGIAPDPNDPLVKLSAESELIVGAGQEIRARDGDYAISPDLLKMITSVGEVEPLGWTVSDVYSSYADFKGVNVIAVLPDEAFSIIAFGNGNKIRTIQAVNSLVKSGLLQLEEEGVLHRFTPVDRWESATDFTPRPAMAKLIKSLVNKGRIDVRDYALYAFESKRLNRGGLADLFTILIDPSLMGNLDFESWDGMRLFGSLTPRLQQDLEKGGSIKYAGMNGAQKQIAERIIYKGVLRSEERMERLSSRLTHQPVEPTDAFPNGIPNDAQLTSKSINADTIVAYGKDKAGKVKALRSINAWTLAHVIAEGGNNPSMMRDYGLPNLVGYAAGVDRMLSLRLVVAPGLWKEMPLMLPVYDDQANPQPWEKLPEQLRKQVQTAIQQLQQQRQNQNGGSPPPP